MNGVCDELEIDVQERGDILNILDVSDYIGNESSMDLIDTFTDHDLPYMNLDNYSILDELSSCSSDPTITLPISCIDSEFLSTRIDYNLYTNCDHLLRIHDQIDPDINLFTDYQRNTSFSTPAQMSPILFKNQSKLSFLHINARSILPKIDDLLIILALLPVKIVALTETWLTPDSESALMVPGYKVICNSRKDTVGGGVALLIREDVKYNLLSDSAMPVHSSYERLFVTLPQEKGPDLIVGAIYRPPGLSLIEFNDDFFQLIPKLSGDRHQLILLGDYNIDMLKVNNHGPTMDFLNSLSSFFITPIINCPTRVTENTMSLIDNILTNMYDKIQEPTVLLSDFSDHFPILFWMDVIGGCTDSKILKNTIVVNDKKIKDFNASLGKLDWAGSRNAIDSNETELAYDLFMNDYMKTYNKVFVASTCKKTSHSPRKPWMTAGLLRSCNTKNRLYARYRKRPTEKNKALYLRYRNIFKKLKTRIQRSYYQDEFAKYSHDLKKTWRVIKNIIDDRHSRNDIECLQVGDKNIRDPDMIASHFNSFFSNVGQSLASKIKTSAKSFVEFLPPSKLNSFSLLPTSPPEILAIAGASKHTRSIGPDNIDPLIGLGSLGTVVDIFSEIINSSFSTGQIPSDLKKARLIPIFKQGDRLAPTNYRPISILPYFAKLMEKVMYVRLYDYVEKSDILDPRQFGFRKEHSVEMALVRIQELITNAIDNRKFAIGIFLDLAKAFDTVDHSILLTKLSGYGIRGTPLLWFTNYLKERKQQVHCSGVYSDFLYVNCGVPQGSNLGPLLFLLYINDLPRATGLLKGILFADDTNLFYTHDSLSVLMGLVNDELEILVEWFKANRLSLNIDKTYYIIFSSRNKNIAPDINNNITIDGKLILRVKNVKFLGIYIDEHLTWNHHIQCISKKVAKNVGIIRRVSYLLPINILRNLYFTLIYPYLAFGNIVWASNYKSRTGSLLLLQKRVIRVLFKDSYYAHTAPRFLQMGIIRFDQLNTYLIGIFVYRAINKLLPHQFHGYFGRVEDRCGPTTRSVGKLVIQYARTNIKRFSVYCQGPAIWNKIPDIIRNSSTLSSFKKTWKKFILIDKCL